MTVTAPILKIRSTLDDSPMVAMMQADSVGDADERALTIDYVCQHLKIPHGQWDERIVLARASIWVEAIDPEDWESWDYRREVLSCFQRPLVVAFAVECAERSLQGERSQGREPDKRSWRALEATKAWFQGEVSDEDVKAAANAAYDAANAAYDAADAAAYAAAAAATVAAAAAATVAYAAYAAHARKEERQWQISHLSHLCTKWALHGDQTPHILWGGKS